MGSPLSWERSSDDEDYVPEVTHKKKGLKKRKVRRQRRPDFSALSIPKPVQRLDPDLNLSAERLRGAMCEEYKLSALGRSSLSDDASHHAAAHLIAGSKEGGPPMDDLLVSQWMKIYKVKTGG